MDMNKFILAMSTLLSCNLVFGEISCDIKSTNTNDIATCIMAKTTEIENEIKFLISMRISASRYANVCKEQFIEHNLGKEAYLEELLCYQNQVLDIKDNLQREYLDFLSNNKKSILSEKIFLYSKPGQITKSYLVKGDQVTILDEKEINNSYWYFINYKGKKDINMWIKAEAVDFSEKE